MDKDRIVRIDWVDPHSVDDWTAVHDIDTSTHYLVTSIGRLIRETSDAFVITLNYASDDDTASCSMVIPKVCVKRIEDFNGS